MKPANTLPFPLSLLAEQLWFGVDPAIGLSLRRARAAPAPETTVLERYWVLPTPQHARMLLPAAGRDATVGAATNYRRLRPPRERAIRRTIGALARTGAPLAPMMLHVEVPTHAADVARTLPTRTITETLGAGDLHASVGIRPGANGKATLQLVHTDGRPAGYAKLGWNALTDDYVRTETESLSALGRLSGRVRTPAVLATFEYAGHPVLVTEPLPEDVRAIRGGVPGPTPAELYALCPVVRSDLPGATAHLRDLHRRLQRFSDALVTEPADRARQLLTAAAATRTTLPVTTRWHGDFAPWNCARDGDDELWVWDWESSEPDALAGLDALHWAFSDRRRRLGDVASVSIADCVADAGPQLTAAGVPRAAWRCVAQVYVATVIERACGLAVNAGGWERVWISPQELAALAEEVTGAAALQ